jgi:hypothetical protein
MVTFISSSPVSPLRSFLFDLSYDYESYKDVSRISRNKCYVYYYDTENYDITKTLCNISNVIGCLCTQSSCNLNERIKDVYIRFGYMIHDHIYRYRPFYRIFIDDRNLLSNIFKSIKIRYDTQYEYPESHERINPRYIGFDIDTKDPEIISNWNNLAQLDETENGYHAYIGYYEIENLKSVFENTNKYGIDPYFITSQLRDRMTGFVFSEQWKI